jgi:hypothetical protein
LDVSCYVQPNFCHDAIFCRDVLPPYRGVPDSKCKTLFHFFSSSYQPSPLLPSLMACYLSLTYIILMYLVHWYTYIIHLFSRFIT